MYRINIKKFKQKDKGYLLKITPFSIYTISWILVFVLYELCWSDLYPKLTYPLISFLLLTSFVSYLIHNHIKNRNKYKFRPFYNADKYLKFLNIFLLIAYAFLFLEFYIAKLIPLFVYSIGNVNDDTMYMNFGIPGIKILLTNSWGFISSLSSYAIFSKQTKKKGIYIIYVILSLIPPVLCVQRGVFLSQIFSIIVIYFMSHRIKIKRMLYLIALSFIILFLFGFLGNIRSGDADDKSFMNNMWGANKNFEKSNMPPEIFWAYIYASSPLANLQLTIKEKRAPLFLSNGISDFMLSSVVPQTFSKELKDNISRHYCLISPNLFVCTTYCAPYITLGWIGLILFYIYIVSFIFLFIRLIRYNSPFRVPLIACLCSIVFFSIFDNMTAYMGILPQLVIYLFLSWILNKTSIRYILLSRK